MNEWTNECKNTDPLLVKSTTGISELGQLSLSQYPEVIDTGVVGSGITNLELKASPIFERRGLSNKIWIQVEHILYRLVLLKCSLCNNTATLLFFDTPDFRSPGILTFQMQLKYKRRNKRR